MASEDEKNTRKLVFLFSQMSELARVKSLSWGLLDLAMDRPSVYLFIFIVSYDVRFKMNISFVNFTGF